MCLAERLWVKGVLPLIERKVVTETGAALHPRIRNLDGACVGAAQGDLASCELAGTGNIIDRHPEFFQLRTQQLS